MGKKSKASMPAAPDYTALANQQSDLSKQQAEWELQQNRVNQSNPMGNLTWSQDPTSGQWTQSTTLNPQAQENFNWQQYHQGQLGTKLGEGISTYDPAQVELNKNIPGQADYSGAPGMPSIADYSKAPAMPGVADYSSLGDMPTVGGYNQQVIDTINALQSPALDRQRAAKEAQMAAMGLGMGSGSAYNTQQNLIGQNENDAYLKSILAGINQGNTEFGQGMQRYQQGATNLNNQFTQGLGLRQQGVGELNNQFMQGLGLRQQGVGEADNQFSQQLQSIGLGNQTALAEKQANLGQLSGLMGLTQGQLMPQFAGYNKTDGYQTPDLMGAAKANYEAQVAQANAKNKSGGGLLGTLGGLAGTALGGMASPFGAAAGGALGKSIFGGGGYDNPTQTLSI